MLWRVLLPLALTWLLGSALALVVASYYTRKAFDRSLLDDAHAVAANLSVRGGELQFNLSPREVGAVLFDKDEKTFFAVMRLDGSLIAGQGGLRDAAQQSLEPGPEPWTFEDVHYRGIDLRMVTLRRELPAPCLVVVAQTTRSRTQLASPLVAASLLPQALLLLLLGTWLGRSIDAELRPLAGLEQALAERDTHDLAPVHLAPQSHDIALLLDAFNALMARIGAGVQAQREFAGNVAHELRTPLAGIRSLAAYGLTQTEPAVWAEQLRRIADSEKRASHLVDQLLALAMADEARDSLQLEAVPVHSVVQELLVRLLPQADALGVDLGAEGLEQPLWVLATLPLLEGVLGNLADNALRYGRPADATRPGPTPCVTVGVESRGPDVLISVTDNGPGMDAEQRRTVRQRWEQGSVQAGHGHGFGLGLAIVDRYVVLLGGRFELDAAPDGPGLRARVWLQRAPPPEGTAG